jgi:hypothetical protein
MGGRDMSAQAAGTLVICRNPFAPWKDRTVTALPRKRVRVCTLAPRTSQPVLCFVNGRPLPAHAWRRRVAPHDHVAFAVLPHGGGKSNPLQLIATIAIAYFTGPIGTSLAASMGVTSAIGIAVIKAGVGIALTGLSSALFGATVPRLRTRDGQAPSPTYNLAAQGNTARLGQAIPVQYGRHISFPDYAAQPYVEYSGNEQYLYQLFVIGQGEYEIEQLRISDTPISSFTEITTEIVAPGGSLTLFPAEVVTSDEVSGQEAVYTVALGPFVAANAGTVAHKIGVDVVMPRGLYIANDDGSIGGRSITWTVEAQAIDDAGTAIGSWVTLGSHSYSVASTTPQRLSYTYNVTSGRHQVRLTRTSTKSTDPAVGNDFVWAGLRAYLTSVRDYGSVTLLAVRAKASNNLSSQTSRRINVIATRKLPVWNGSTWSAPTVTRSIAWAIADVLRADYGAGVPDSRIDLAGLLVLDAVWSARGDTLDIRVDATQTVWETLSTAARAGRASVFSQGGIVRCVRDQLQTLPTAMFSMRNIVRGSLSLDYAMASDQTADAVDVSYFDETTWSERIVRCALPGSSEAIVAPVQLVGVTSRDQAWREGMFLAGVNRYRRRTVTFATEMEGLIVSLGDLIAVQHDMPQWGQFSEIRAWDAGTNTATLAQDLDWSASGVKYIALRARDGSVLGPFEATQAGADNLVTLDTAPAETPYTGGAAERTHVAFGVGTALYIRALVLSVRPLSATRAEIVAVIESDAVHSVDTGVVPGADAWQLPITPTRPRVGGLIARSDVLDVNNALLSWAPAAGADRYLIEQSADRVSWTRSGETAANSFTTRAIYGAATYFRVAGIGAALGIWAEVAYGSSAAYMWSADDTTLMWSVDDTLPMWMN